MSPLDPVEYIPSPDHSPTTPDDEQEYPVDLVEIGLRVAGNEAREAVTDEYEEEAMESDDPETALADIAFVDESSEEQAPEIAALTLDAPPET